MKTPTKLTLLSLLIALAPLAADAGPPHQPRRPIKPGVVKPVRPQVVKPLRLKTDLAASKIEFSVVRRTGRTTGVVRITGVIKNVGSHTWRSRNNQQGAYLYQGNRLLAVHSHFGTLRPGQEVRFSYTRSWLTSDEFPPTFRLALRFDPDIANDGNPHNDDQRSRNNQISRSGYEMHGVLERALMPAPPHKQRKIRR